MAAMASALAQTTASAVGALDVKFAAQTRAGAPASAAAALSSFPAWSSIKTTHSARRTAAAPSFERTTFAVHAVQEEVDMDADSGSPSGAQGANQGTKLYVGNLPFNVDSESLAGIFGQAGEVDQVDVIYDRETGRSRGFAFVTMASNEDAEAAIEKFDGTELGGRMLRVNFPVAKGERPMRTERGGERIPRGPPRSSSGSSPSSGSSSAAGTKLYVGNLSWGMDDYGLADLFSEFGEVMEAKVVLDRETGRSRGFGFVTFGSPSEGGVAVNALDGVEVDGRTIRVSVAQDRNSAGGGRF